LRAFTKGSVQISPGGESVTSIKTRKGESYQGTSQEVIVARLRRELKESNEHIDRLEIRLKQFEQHRNRPLLRDLEANMDALEAVGVDGWPKMDEGRSSGHSSGSRGDKMAVARLIHIENTVRSLNTGTDAWLDQRQEQQIHGIKIA